MIEAFFKKHILSFKRPAGTSRGILKTKDTFFIILKQDGRYGIGECGLLRGLSVDDTPDYEAKLQWTCDHIEMGEALLYKKLTAYPSIQIGVETAFKSLHSEDPFQVFPSAFSKGAAKMEINGLIWMGDKQFMKDQVSEKIAQGFGCIKMKIGAIDFETELDLLKSIRKEFSHHDIELRVDANGAFAPDEALEKLKQLSALNLHSIEQPIRQGNWENMARLCEQTPLPIALDEELIGVFSEAEQKRLLDTIQPQYIILKPSFIGGFRGTDGWIVKAAALGIDWWVTSALESNIGLNAISQYTFTKNSTLPQGLGTGSLYTNNIDAPLEIDNGNICINPHKGWDVTSIL